MVLVEDEFGAWHGRRDEQRHLGRDQVVLRTVEQHGRHADLP